MGLPAGERLIRAGALDSTNEEARRRARAGERGPLWILAERQAAGRGRRGRTWVSEPGNFFATLLSVPGRPAAQRAQLSLIAAVALHDALESFISSSPGGEGKARGLSLKWPNDILAGGGKVAGILLEGEGDWIALGVGVNLVHAPSGVAYTATSLLDAFGVTVAPGDLLDRLAARLADWRRRDFADARAAWLERAAGLGEALEVHLAGGVRRGRFVDLDSDGALLLEVADGSIERITAGDVFLIESGEC